MSPYTTPIAVSVSGARRLVDATAARDDVAGSAEEVTLNLHLHAQFDDALRWEAEIGCRADGVAGHQYEELLTPDRHSATVCDENRLAAQEIGHVVGVDVEPAALRRTQRVRHIGILHEAVQQAHHVDTRTKVIDCDLFV